MSKILISVLFLVFSSSVLAQRASIEVTKVFADSNTAPVEIHLDCNTGILSSQWVTLNPGTSVEFVVTDFTNGTLNCRITETDTPSFTPSYNNGSTVSSEECLFENLSDGASVSCAVTNSPNPALINVSKIYSDGTNGPVQVEIDCNSGLIPQQSKIIDPSAAVVFVVSAFPSGELDCRVTEDVPPGYTASFDTGSIVSATDCTFDNLELGDEVDCVVTNTLDPRAVISVSKEWADGRSDAIEVMLDCNSGVLPSISAFITPGSPVDFVVTDFPSGELDCRVSEAVPPGYQPNYDNGVSSSVSCEFEDLLAGAGVYCDITNSPASADEDRDGVLSISDNCPTVANALQGDNDNDKDGDACDPDDDNDQAPDAQDNCPYTENPNQEDSDNNGIGDACEGDRDGDTRLDNEDNCVNVPNKKQFDFDGDGQGDACDADWDNDGVANAADACRQTVDLDIFDPNSGCSFEQLCPCEGPKGQDVPWRNHAEFVDCVVITSKNFKQAKIITGDERGALREAARASDCGR